MRCSVASAATTDRAAEETAAAIARAWRSIRATGG
jgi:hypothetical protein